MALGSGRGGRVARPGRDGPPLIALLLLALALLLPVAASAAVSPSISPDQVGLVYGDTATFTMIYPHEATITPRRPQFGYNPWAAGWCSPEDGSEPYYFQVPVAKHTEHNIGDHMLEGTSDPVQLPYLLPSWLPGVNASCIAYLVSFRADGSSMLWAQTLFEVAGG